MNGEEFSMRCKKNGEFELEVQSKTMHKITSDCLKIVFETTCSNSEL